MKHVVLFATLLLAGNFLWAQNKTEADKLVDEGVAYHDKGDYDGALVKYNTALEIDTYNVYALSEKAYTLCTTKKYTEAIEACKLAIEKHPKNELLGSVYVTLGNSYDGLNKTDKSIETYNEGISLFPDYYQLPFNKGVSLASVKKYDDAIVCFQQAVKLNPKHASSHNAIARISFVKNKKIASLLAYCRFMAIEPQSERAAENVGSIQKIMKGDAEETGKNSITIHIDPSILGDTAVDGKPKENSFSTVALILSMDAAMDLDKKNKKKNDAEQFQRKFETVCSSLKESQKNNYGFYWEYYVPYFIEMKEKNQLETFSYLVFASSENPDIAKWLKGHKNEIDAFFTWSKAYQWPEK